MSKIRSLEKFWEGLHHPPTWLDNVFKYPPFFWMLPLSGRIDKTVIICILYIEYSTSTLVHISMQNKVIGAYTSIIASTELIVSWVSFDQRHDHVLLSEHLDVPIQLHMTPDMWHSRLRDSMPLHITTIIALMKTEHSLINFIQSDKNPLIFVISH